MRLKLTFKLYLILGKRTSKRFDTSKYVYLNTPIIIVKPNYILICQFVLNILGLTAPQFFSNPLSLCFKGNDFKKHK